MSLSYSLGGMVHWKGVLNPGLVENVAHSASINMEPPGTGKKTEKVLQGCNSPAELSDKCLGRALPELL